ncbi:MAG: hypothetical protein GY869_32600, partial [Planctomycetes bacterium]|nr:hypothetical protein [Planctomycetota bacterium]
TLTSPAGGEQWEVGSSHNITWTSSETFDFVSIEFSPTGGFFGATIISSTPNDGSYNWVVPNSISDSCRIRVEDIDGSPADYNTGFFSIVPVPAVTVTSPNGGEVWGIDTSQDITWTSVGAVGDIKIELSTDNGTSWSTIVTSTANDGSYNWTVQGSPSGNCLLRVGEIDGTPSDVNDAVFSVIQPTVTVTSPNGGETWDIDTSHPITWTSYGTAGNVKIDYSTDNGTTWTAVTASTADDGSYNWTVPHAPSGNCLIRVGEIDGIPSDISDGVFSIVLPPIIITSPSGGETWEKNSSHPITWTYTSTVDFIKIDYSTDNGATWTTVTASTANDGSYDWTVPDTPSEGCLVRVGETGGDPYRTSDKVLSIVDELEPGITVTSPNGGEVWEIDSNRDIPRTSTGNVG